MNHSSDLVSRVRHVLGFRKLVVMMRLCVRNGRRRNCSNNENREEFLQKIVHETSLMGESLTKGLHGALQNADTV